MVDGFHELAGRLHEANERAAAQGARAALTASAHAYIDFALSQPGVYRVMFRPDACNPSRLPAVREAGARARAELDRLNRVCHGEGSTPARATVLWAHVHGMACLLIDGPLAPDIETPTVRTRAIEEAVDEFVDLLVAPSVAVAPAPPTGRKARAG